MRTVYKSAKEFIIDSKNGPVWVLCSTESSICDTTLWINVHIIFQTGAFMTGGEAVFSAKNVFSIETLFCVVC